MMNPDVHRWQRAAPPPYSRPVPARADELVALRQGYCGLVVLAAAFQLIFFSRSAGNLPCVLMALVSSLIGISYALNGARFRAQPISALILIFYTTSATSGALLIKTLEWSALVDRLLIPSRTFGVLLMTQLALLVADRIYHHARPLHRLRRFLNRQLQRSGAMNWPSDWQLWLLGLIGLASVVMSGGTDFESGISFGMAAAGGKLLRAFVFLKYAPFLIPFRDALCGFPSRGRFPVVSLGIYFLCLVGVSFATNSRSTFADAVPTVGICILLAKGVGRIDFRKVPVSRLIVIGLAAAIGSVLLSRVALAMVVVRDYRYGVDAGSLIRLTVEALFNSEWLDAAQSKMDTEVHVGNYSETYVDSRFFARFLLTKYHDNILYYLGLFGEDHLHAYRDFMADRLIATLPDPLLRYFNLNVDKQDLAVSNGDYIVYIIDGWGLGGYKTGSMIAEVFGVYGWAFPLVIAGSALMLFTFHDAFVTPTAQGRLAFAPLILLLIWNLVGTTAAFGLGAETVTAIPSGILRGLPQSVIAYVVAAAFARFVSRVVGRR